MKKIVCLVIVMLLLTFMPSKVYAEELDKDSLINFIQIIIESLNDEERDRILELLQPDIEIEEDIEDTTETTIESKVIYRGIGSERVLDIKTDKHDNIYILYPKFIQRYTPDGKGVFRPIEVEGVSYKKLNGETYFATPESAVGDALYYDEEEDQMYMLCFFDGSYHFTIYKINDNLTLDLEKDCKVQAETFPTTQAGNDFLTKVNDEWMYSSCMGVASVFYHIYTPKTYYKRLPMNSIVGDAEVIVNDNKLYIFSSDTGALIYYNLEDDETYEVASLSISNDTKVATHGDAFYYEAYGSIFKLDLDGSLSEYIPANIMNLQDRKLGNEDDICIDRHGNLIYTDRGFLKMKYKRVT